MVELPDVRKIPSALEGALVTAFRVQLDTRAIVTTKASTWTALRNEKIDCLTSMSLESSKYAGCLALAFPRETLLKIIERMLGESHPELNPENSDAAGELLNIIYTSARKNINEAGFDFGLALPATTIGKNFSLANSRSEDAALLFDGVSDLGPFRLFFSLWAKT